MHYSSHRLTASVTYVTTLTYATRQLITNGPALLAHWSVSQKLNRVSSVQIPVYTRKHTRSTHEAGLM